MTKEKNLHSNTRIIKIFPDHCLEEIYELDTQVDISKSPKDHPKALVKSRKIHLPYLKQKYSRVESDLNKSIKRLRSQLDELIHDNPDLNEAEIKTLPSDVHINNNPNVEYHKVFPQKQGQNYNEYIFWLMENWLYTDFEIMNLDEEYQLEVKLRTQSNMIHRFSRNKDREKISELGKKWKSILAKINKDFISETIDKWDLPQKEECTVNCRDFSTYTGTKCRYIKTNGFYCLSDLNSEIESLNNDGIYFEPNLMNLILNHEHIRKLHNNLHKNYTTFLKTLENIDIDKGDEPLFDLINTFINIKKSLTELIETIRNNLPEEALNNKIGSFYSFNSKDEEENYDQINEENKSDVLHITASKRIDNFKIRNFNCCVCHLIDYNIDCYIQCGKDCGKQPIELLEDKGIFFETKDNEKEFSKRLKKRLRRLGFDPHDFMQYKINIGGRKYPCKDGHVVDSKLEVMVDNYLYDREIPHFTPKNYHALDIPFYIENRRGNKMRPDFILKDCYIEVAGLYGWSLSKYNKRMKKKMKICNEKGINLAILKPGKEYIELDGNYKPDLFKNIPSKRGK